MNIRKYITHLKQIKLEYGVFRDILKYVHGNNDFQGGTLLNGGNFSTLFSLIYFDLSKQNMDITDGVTKLSFKYEFSKSSWSR